tara:strand:- start:237 stop:644 length:408 start_codon:yes stop_codon:yes gene_type:complete
MSRYNILKMNNGEDVICKITKTTDSHYVITDALKMEAFSKLTSKGFMETLGLSRWLQPFTEETIHEIPIKSVCLKLDASIGLGKYYTEVVDKMHSSKLERWDAPTDDELREIENVEDLDQIFDEIKDKLKSRTVH